MNNYKSILILHAVDNSTLFLGKFEEEFGNIYVPFDNDPKSILRAKTLIGDLETKSLIIFLGHGSSLGLYEPDETHTYEKFFLGVALSNHYFDEHDIFLLSCKSNELIQKIYKSSYSIGFGNIISSITELGFHNDKNEVKKTLNEDEIDMFNKLYVDCSIKVVKELVSKKINFYDVPKYFRFFINQEINKILLDKGYNNRIEFSRMLFEFRNEIFLKRNNI